MILADRALDLTRTNHLIDSTFWEAGNTTPEELWTEQTSDLPSRTTDSHKEEDSWKSTQSKRDNTSLQVKQKDKNFHWSYL